MLNRINELMEAGETFAFETTLATKSYRSKILEAQAKGYYVTLLFFWLRDSTLAIERVRSRVLEGGHNIDQDVILRRYMSGIKNLFDIYLPIVDEAMILDNSSGKPDLIFEKTLNSAFDIINSSKFDIIKMYYEKA